MRVRSPDWLERFGDGLANAAALATSGAHGMAEVDTGIEARKPVLFCRVRERLNVRGRPAASGWSP